MKSRKGEADGSGAYEGDCLFAVAHIGCVAMLLCAMGKIGKVVCGEKSS